MKLTLLRRWNLNLLILEAMAILLHGYIVMLKVSAYLVTYEKGYVIVTFDKSKKLLRLLFIQLDTRW